MLFITSAAVGFSLMPRAIPAGASVARGGEAFASIAVFGATGGVGGEAAYQALARGEEVTALARDPSGLTVPEGSGGSAAGTPMSGGITCIKGSVTNRADVSTAALPGLDAAYNALPSTTRLDLLLRF